MAALVNYTLKSCSKLTPEVGCVKHNHIVSTGNIFINVEILHAKLKTLIFKLILRSINIM